MPWLVLGNVMVESSTRLARSGRSALEYEHWSFFIVFNSFFMWRNGTITVYEDEGRWPVGQLADEDCGSFLSECKSSEGAGID